ncbi:MAG: CusA/CzcA family heavy metal efflux RND transporter, partial [Bacteroidales bacterium]|nr:CusA/CzcA family heavy metal efflux RND transporter [Bacteroidales bacterium]
MIDKIIKFSINNKFIVLLFTLGIVIWGVNSMLNIPIDAVPDITNNQVQIVTVSPSLAAQEVEQFITYPIEMAMANVQNVQEIRSISRYGLSVVTVVFNENVPILDARQLVGQQLQTAVQEIPEGYGEPELMPITTGLGEIYQYTIDVLPGYENYYTNTDLRTIHDWVVKRQLNGISGIVEISSFGGYLKEYEIAVNPQSLSNYNLSLIDVNQAIKNNNQNTGGSYVQKGPYAYFIRTNGIVSNIQDIENIVVTVVDDVPIKISDIATVQIGHPPRFGAMTKNGKGEAVGGITLMLKGANASKVMKDVKNRIKIINENLPEGLVITPYLDRSELVNRVIHTVSKNLLEGGLIVIFVLVLLLGNVRAGFIVASVIPLAMLFAFGMMKTFGVAATVMSLGAIDFGLIVDATVIIIESIIFQIEHQRQKLTAQSMDTLVMNTTLKIKNSAAFGAIIILIVYLPILALTGIEGKMFRPMALTVGFAIIGALILSFTYVPVISSLFLPKQISDKKTIADRIMALLYKTYRPVFNFALKNKIAVLIFTVVLFVSSIGIFGQLGAEFLPDLDEGDLAMQMTIAPGSSLTESIATTTKAEDILLSKFPEIETIVSKIGTAEVPTDPMAIEDADIMIILKPRSEWTSANTRQELIALMQEELKVIAGASFEFTQPIQLRFNELLTGAKSDVVIKIYGEDLDILAQKANDVAKIISTVDGAADIKVERIEGLPQLVIDYDRNQIARYGLNIQEINTLIRTALAGETVGVVFEGERKFDLVVRLNEDYSVDLDKIKDLYIKTPAGNQIPLQEVASIEFVESPTQISRDGTQRRISIGINVRNRDVQSMVEEIQDKLSANLVLPTGYYVTYGGKFQNLQSALTRLKIVVPIALALIFILLFFAFGTFKQALLIFTTIPLSIIGGIFALYLRGLPFSISAGIGFIALFGVAVLDGIVLINYLNELKNNGVSDIQERIIQGTKSRLRPVTITSAVASMGFLPMAISMSAGAEVQRPLATVVIGGIITSTFLTMIVLPLVYYYFEKGFSKKIKTPKTAIIILLLAIIPLFSNGQNQNDTSYLSLNEAITMMQQDNIQIQNADLLINQKKYLKQSTFDLGQTEFSYQSGQINSNLIDNNISVVQNFGNPVQNITQKNYYKTELQTLEIQKKILINKLIFEISEIFVEWQCLNYQKLLLDTLLADYVKIIEIANLNFQNQNSNYLSKLTIENSYNELFFKRKNISSELKIVEQKIQLYFNTDTVIIPVYSQPEPIILIFQDSLLDDLSNASLSEYYNQQITLFQKNVSVQKSNYFPDVYAGYFNQKIDGISGFQGWEVGISLPLFFWSNQRNVMSSKIDVQIAQNNAYLNLQQSYIKVQNLYQNYSNEYAEVEYYQNTSLKTAELIINNAKILYTNGEIGYFEYIQ